MSKDKYYNKRAYAVRGAATKRKLRRSKAGGGKKTKPGASFITVCPDCPKGAEGSSVGVSGDTNEASCKHGHTWKVV